MLGVESAGWFSLGGLLLVSLLLRRASRLLRLLGRLVRRG